MDKSLIVIGDALQKLQRVASGYCDCCVTSPPYYGLRDYGMPGQIGLQEQPEEYIKSLVIVFREVRRVLRDDGTLWLNIGDSYAGSNKGAAKFPENAQKYKQGTNKGIVGAASTRNVRPLNYKPKDLMGVPWKLAFALQEDGWYLRQDIIWYKPNCMPESVKDRCTKSHEYIFLLSKSKKYYFDYEAIKEPCVGFDNRPPAGSKGTLTSNSRIRKGNSRTFRGGVYTHDNVFDNSALIERNSHGNSPNADGKRNKRDVWSVATRGYNGAHFATFPPELITPCVLAGSREGGIILDPFFGSGTTGEVAKNNNREFLGIELNPEYAKLAAARLNFDLCGQCRHNTNDFVCRPICGGCGGHNNFELR